MNILTFDIEDWFHTHQNRKYYSGHIWKDLPSRLEDNTDRILAMLEELNLKATFFILGWVAEHYPRLIKQIHARGHEIAAHSNWHHNPHLLWPDDFEKDLVMCLSRLSDLIGNPVTTYRAPGFNLRLKDLWAFEIMAAHGITVDSSVQMRDKGQTLPIILKVGDTQILEFPLLKTVYGFPYSGGGYFRALPQFMRDSFFSGDQYRLLYFHPRDFDSENPYSNLFSFSRNWLNRINTDVCMEHLKQIINQQPTYTIGEVVSLYSNNTQL